MSENNLHGLSGLPVYACWKAMHQRCHNPAAPSYYRYGGRGITICRRWDSLHAFLEDMGHPPAGMTLGRIDNDGHYEPSNCRWESQEQQNENTTRNRYVTWRGRTQTIKAWAAELDIEPRRISERLRRGWDAERTLTTPSPRGYQQGRELHRQRAADSWSRNGRRYAAAAAARRNGKALPSPQPAGVKATPSVMAEALALHRQGLTCRQIAERLPISKSTVSNLLRRAEGAR